MQFAWKVSLQIVKFHLLHADTYFIPSAYQDQYPGPKILVQLVEQSVVEKFEKFTYRVPQVFQRLLSKVFSRVFSLVLNVVLSKVLSKLLRKGQ